MSTPQDIFSQWKAHCESEPSRWSEFDAVYRWVVTGEGGGTWTMRCKDKPEVVEGAEDGIDVEATVSVEDFVAIARGELNPQMAFMSGKLKVAGDMGMALRLGSILGNLVEEKRS